MFHQYKSAYDQNIYPFVDVVPQSGHLAFSGIGSIPVGIGAEPAAEKSHQSPVALSALAANTAACHANRGAAQAHPPACPTPETPPRHGGRRAQRQARRLLARWASALSCHIFPRFGATNAHCRPLARQQYIRPRRRGHYAFSMGRRHALGKPQGVWRPRHGDGAKHRGNRP